MKYSYLYYTHVGPLNVQGEVAEKSAGYKDIVGELDDGYNGKHRDDVVTDDDVEGSSSALDENGLVGVDGDVADDDDVDDTGPASSIVVVAVMGDKGTEEALDALTCQNRFPRAQHFMPCLI
ncbi:hypothetical protein BGX26_001346 [Mortierella sp. AD094]|nr:hypothetical protein BGX26_001346 [Mortierella sp. AD094]